MRKLILKKESVVHTDAVVDYQCKAKGHQSYEYSFEIEAATDSLDEFDFIIDHVILHRVIETVVREQMGSCERLLLNAEKEILRTLKEHGTVVLGMRLSIKPLSDPPSNAWVRFEADYSALRPTSEQVIEDTNKQLTKLTS